jgi:hypothetical protein
MRNMEKSTHFHQPQVLAETVVTNTSDQGQSGAIQFDIAAVYVPGAMEAEAPQTAEDSTGAAAASPKTSAPAMAPGAPHKLPVPMFAPNARAGSVQPNVNAAQNQPVAPSMRGH